MLSRFAFSVSVNGVPSCFTGVLPTSRVTSSVVFVPVRLETSFAAFVLRIRPPSDESPEGIAYDTATSADVKPLIRRFAIDFLISIFLSVRILNIY